MLGHAPAARFYLCVAGCAALSACAYAPSLDFDTWNAAEPLVAAPDPGAPRAKPLATRQFEGVAADEELLGAVQVVFARHENTFVQLAREYDVGYDELRLANPGVDVWLPGEDTAVFLPTMNVIPDVARDGIVLNLPSMRLFYFVEDAPAGADAPMHTVTSHPVGIGRQGWETPTGEAEVTGKARDPTWYPPASVRAEHAELGDPLPSVVPAGPDNPLGAFAMGLSMPGYLIHGTNKPAGVGMRVSHGCIRLYPEDIEALFDRVPSGTPVRIIDEPVLAGWRDGDLFLEVHAPLAEDERDLSALAERAIAAAFERAGVEGLPLDAEQIVRVVTEQRGIPFPILNPGPGIDAYLAGARVVENTIPPAVAEATARE
jgi:L,D-transpeptidase ErfK/SrfK